MGLSWHNRFIAVGCSSWLKSLQRGGFVGGLNRAHMHSHDAACQDLGFLQAADGDYEAPKGQSQAHLLLIFV